MPAPIQAIQFLVVTLLQLYIFVVLLRFLLQLAKADFYNPVSQAIVKLTAPILHPLRRLIPGFKGLDMASLLLALVLYLLAFIVHYAVIPPLLNSVRWSVAGIANHICNIYFFAIIGAAIVSWIPALHQHPVTALVWQLVEPIQAPFRKILPNLGGIDISPIFALLAIQVIQILVKPFVLL